MKMNWKKWIQVAIAVLSAILGAVGGAAVASCVTI